MKKLLLAALAVFMMGGSVVAETIQVKIAGGGTYPLDVTNGMSLDQIRVMLERKSAKILRFLAMKDGSGSSVSNYSETFGDFKAAGKSLVAKLDPARAEAGHYAKTQAEIDAAEKVAADASRVDVRMPDGSGVLSFEFDPSDTVGDLRARVWDAFEAVKRGDIDFATFGIWQQDVSGAFGLLNNDTLVNDLDKDYTLRAMISTVDMDDEVELIRKQQLDDARFRDLMQRADGEREAAAKIAEARMRAEGKSDTPSIDEILRARREAAEKEAAETPAQKMLREMKERRAAREQQDGSTDGEDA